MLCGIYSVVIKGCSQYNVTYCVSSLAILLALPAKPSVVFGEPIFSFSFVHLVTKFLHGNAPSAGKLILSLGSVNGVFLKNTRVAMAE